MAPFPETEIMTIKRLQVALRKMDFKLLKDGAYKLHEKFHSGFKFEYLDLLKEILLQTANNASIPTDIKDILCPTIQDILSSSGTSGSMTEQGETVNNAKVSNLTQMSYNSSLKNTNVLTEEAPQDSQKVTAFDVFGTKHGIENRTTNYVSEPISNNYGNQQNVTENNKNSNAENYQNDTFMMNNILVQEEAEKPVKPKNIAIYYGQDNSSEKIKNILNYKEMLSKIENEHYSISQILKLISEINVQTDTNVSELKNILDQIKLSNNKLSLITNSSSRELIDLFENEEYSYSIFDKSDDKQMALIPVFGLSNQFACLNCKEEYIDKNSPVKPLIIECPKCKSPMFPNFYAANKQNNQINMKYYNNALVALANSNIWVLIHPSTEDKLFQSMLINAFKLNREIETVYILEKDINLRESFRREFASVNENVEINIQMNALEDFINSLK